MDPPNPEIVPYAESCKNCGSTESIRGIPCLFRGEPYCADTAYRTLRAAGLAGEPHPDQDE